MILLVDFVDKKVIAERFLCKAGEFMKDVGKDLLEEIVEAILDSIF